MPVPHFLYDDAYITLASAQAVWLGHDPHFPGTPPLYGVTSPFHCAAVAALLAIFPPEWALIVSCLAGAVAYAWGLWRLGRHEGLAPAASAGLVVAGLGAGMVSQHLVNGLETSWAMATVVWLLASARRGHERALGLIAGTAPFVRPELAVVAGLLVAAAAWREPARRRRLIGCAALASAPWLLWLFAATGSLVPTTLAAKRDWYAEACWPAGRRLRVVGAGIVGWLWPMPAVALGVAGLARSGVGRLLLASSAVVLAVWAWSVPSVLHAYQRHRYFVPFVPMLLYGLTRLPPWARTPAIAAAAVLAAVTTAGVVRNEPEAIGEAARVRDDVVAALRADGGRRVLLHDAGYLAFSGAMPEGVDMVGLKTPGAAALHASLTGPTCGAGRGRAIARLAARTGPTHLVIWAPWDDYFGVTAALRTDGWVVSLTRTIDALEPVHVYALRAPAGAPGVPEAAGPAGR